MSRYWCEVSSPKEGYEKAKENLFDFLESENFPATYSEINKPIGNISEVPNNEHSSISIIPIDTISAAIAKHKENPLFQGNQKDFLLFLHIPLLESKLHTNNDS